MSPDDDRPDPAAPDPRHGHVHDAVIQRAGAGRHLSSLLLWLVPVAAAAASIGFFVAAARSKGPLVTVYAAHGYGIGAGDKVRYLGIEVGRIEEVGLLTEEDPVQVRLEIQLRADAADLAVEGSRFWIVRPELSLDSVRGLDTIIGAQYVALLPGPDGARRRTEFTALGEAPLGDEKVESRGGLEIVLEAQSRFGLQRGAAITYRGVRIGTVVAVGLASDATRVEVRALIRGAYVQLVRENSVFWETGGVEVAVSLTGGFKLDLDSLRTALVGGIAMATPVESGQPVAAGTRFELRADADEEWLAWSPPLPLGSDLTPPGTVMPRLLRANLGWTEGRIIKNRSSRTGWLRVTPEGLVGPADLLEVPEDARGGKATLEVAGRTFGLDAVVLRELVAPPEEQGALATLRAKAFGDGWEALASSGSDLLASPPTRTLLEPEDLLVVREAGRAPLGVDAQRLRFTEQGVLLDPRLPVSEAWHGAVVLARSDGAAVGVILFRGDGSARIASR